jgi:hypothetical protein
VQQAGEHRVETARAARSRVAEGCDDAQHDVQDDVKDDVKDDE